MEIIFFERLETFLMILLKSIGFIEFCEMCWDLRHSTIITMIIINNAMIFLAVEKISNVKNDVIKAREAEEN